MVWMKSARECKICQLLWCKKLAFLTLPLSNGFSRRNGKFSLKSSHSVKINNNFFSQARFPASTKSWQYQKSEKRGAGETRTETKRMKRLVCFLPPLIFGDPVVWEFVMDKSCLLSFASWLTQQLTKISFKTQQYWFHLFLRYYFRRRKNGKRDTEPNFEKEENRSGKATSFPLKIREQKLLTSTNNWDGRSLARQFFPQIFDLFIFTPVFIFFPRSVYMNKLFGEEQKPETKQ